MKRIKTIGRKVKCCIAEVVRSGADMATAKVLMLMWNGMVNAIAHAVIYMVIVPVMFVTLVSALPYIVMRKLTGIDLIDW